LPCFPRPPDSFGNSNDFGKQKTILILDGDCLNERPNQKKWNKNIAFYYCSAGLTCQEFFGIETSFDPWGVTAGFSFLIPRRVDFSIWNPLLLLSGCGSLDHAGGLPPQKDLHDLCRRRRDEHEGQHHQPVARAQGNRVHEGLQEGKVDGCQQKQEG